jgi:hypothetical protein
MAWGRRLRSITATLALLFVTRTALAAAPWVRRPFVLPSLGVSADIGLGVGQLTLIDPYPLYDTPIGTTKVGSGLDMEAALGLFGCMELGLRLGARFSPGGALTVADAYGSLSDPTLLHVDTGTASFANPEFRLRLGFFDTPFAAGGLEIGVVPGASPGSDSVAMPGIPLRFRSPGKIRVDTGLYLPVTFVRQDNVGVEIPLALWLQHDDFFYGPLTGFFFNYPSNGFGRGDGPSELAIHAGVGVGYTVARVLDLKAQLLTLRLINSDWARAIGGGIDVGLVLP